MPDDTSTNTSSPAAVILAAGLGKRMQSDLPKVLHPVGDKPMAIAVIDACRQAGCTSIVLVVGHKQELVREAIATEAASRASAGEPGWDAGITFAIQAEQLGTGHAVLCAKEQLASQIDVDAPVLVLAGDGPLIRATTLNDLLNTHATQNAAASLATSVIDNPTGYGRIVRDVDGNFAEIVEQKNCTEEQLAINEVNPSYYCFNAASLFKTLDTLEPNEVTGEYYITDVPALLLAQGRTVAVVPSVPPEDVLSINTLEQLAEVDAIFRRRTSPATSEAR